MKKKFFLVGALVAMSMSAMFVACNNNAPANGCKCAITFKGEDMGTETIDLQQMKEWNVATCSEVAKYLVEKTDIGGSDTKADCKGY